MSADTAELAARIDAAVREVPGVSELYFAAPLPARLWRVAVDRAETFSTVSAGDEGYEATVSIGVAHDRADAVAHLVAARVRDVLGDPAARVTVRVSRISPAERA